MRNTPLNLAEALAYLGTIPVKQDLRVALRNLLKRGEIVVLDSGTERGLVFVSTEVLARLN
jgi:hypothetical protein